MGLKNISQNRKIRASTKVKVMLAVFFFVYGGVVHQEFSPHGMSTNSTTLQ